MKIMGPSAVFFLFFLMVSPASTQNTSAPKKSPKNSTKKAAGLMTGSAGKGSEAARLKVAPGLDKRVAKFREVRMPFHSAGLTLRERQMVQKLVEACNYLEDIFWRQSDPEALALYHSLAGSKNPRDNQLRGYVWINAS